jgi:hypothetical protein
MVQIQLLVAQDIVFFPLKFKSHMVQIQLANNPLYRNAIISLNPTWFRYNLISVYHYNNVVLV